MDASFPEINYSSVCMLCQCISRTQRTYRWTACWIFQVKIGF